MNVRLLILLAVGLCGTIGAAPASAAATPRTWAVSPHGADGQSGTARAPLRTLGAALARARAGDRIELAAGSYAFTRDGRRRRRKVTIVGRGPRRTRVAGFGVLGGERLVFRSLRFTGPVRVREGHGPGWRRPARSVRFSRVHFSDAATCLMIRDGARRVAVTHSRFVRCGTAISGPNTPYFSSHIRIERNTIAGASADGIQIGAWRHVRIVHNLIRDISDPAGIVHNDAIQLVGNVSDVEISANRLLRSRGQLLFIQDATGPIDGLDVTNNLLVGAGAVAVQSQGATHARFVYNTIWNGKDGGLWLRPGSPRRGTRVVPRDTVVVDNIASTLAFMGGAQPARSSGNVVSCPVDNPSVTVPRGARCVARPGFVDAARGKFRLRARSPTRRLGTPLRSPRRDIDRKRREKKPPPGAYR